MEYIIEDINFTQNLRDALSERGWVDLASDAHDLVPVGEWRGRQNQV